MSSAIHPVARLRDLIFCREMGQGVRMRVGGPPFPGYLLDRAGHCYLRHPVSIGYSVIRHYRVRSSLPNESNKQVPVT